MSAVGLISFQTLFAIFTNIRRVKNAEAEKFQENRVERERIRTEVFKHLKEKGIKVERDEDY